MTNFQPNWNTKRKFGVFNPFIKLLYLETGATLIRWVIKQRRINFLKHIISKDNDELVKNVYVAQKEDPNIGDFVKLVKKD